MSRVLLILLCTVSLSFAGTRKMVVNLTTGNMETFMVRFLGGVPGTVDYFTARGDTVEVSVVIHGDAYKFFIDNLENTQYGVEKQLVSNQEAIRKRLVDIQKEYKMTFEICRSGMNRKGILTEDIYPFVTPIQSAMIGLVKWQNEGYADVPVP